MRLEGKIALVTGAGRGIGAAIARAFAAEGARVVVTDLDAQTGQQVADSLNPKAQFLRLDVRDEDQWLAAMDWVMQQFARLDILVNNAGITGFEDSDAPQDPEFAALEDWRRVHATNLDGVFLGCKYAIRMMRNHGTGSIINISSRSGLVGIPAAAAYASSKAAVRNHTKSVALYCAQQGWAIRCNSIHPAAVLTPMWDAMLGTGPDRDVRMAEFVSDTPLRRFGTPEEVAALAIYLGSDESGYMTGSELHLDGGILAGSSSTPKK